MDQAGVDGIQIAAIAMMAGVLAYAVYRFDCALRAWGQLMREVDKQLREQIKNSSASLSAVDDHQ